MKYNVIDAHCDTALRMLNENKSLSANDLSIDIEKMKKNKAHIQFFAFFIEKKYDNPLSRTNMLIDKLYQELNATPDITLIKQYCDVLNVLNEEKCGMIFAIEDARALCGEIHNLNIFYNLGVRAMTLAWNDDNEVTDGISSQRGHGLTEFGFEVVRKMNDLKMIIDVSHITEKGFWDVMSTSVYPIIASHSNAYKICPHVRNLNDEQIEAIIKTNGMIGINFYPLFLNGTKKANTDDIIRHIDYIMSLGGENNIGIGSDFDGIIYMCDDLNSADKYYILFDKMLQMGYSEEQINKISYKNFLSFLKKTL